MAILFLGMMPSCTYDTIFVGDNNANVSLTLTLDEQAINVGSRASDDNFNENKIETVDLFFYKQTGGTAEVPTYSDESDFEVLGYSSQNNPTVSFTMLASEFDVLVADGKKCKVYAIVNRPSTINLSEEDSYSIAELQALELESPDFAVREGSDVSGYTAKQQDSFVMDGSAEVTRNGNALTGSVPVMRVASKISLVMNITDVTAENATWEAEKVTVSLRRASKRTNLGVSRAINVNNDIFHLENIAFTASGNSWTTSVPFYTYPTEWSNNEGARTHMILTIVWKDKNNNANKTTRYYGINVNPGQTSILRNHHYRVSQEIAVLGSEVEEGAIPLTPTCDVLDWYDDVDASGSLSRFKYLVVDETNIVMDNVTTKRIYFNSSDPIYLKHVKVDWDDMSGTLHEWVEQANNDYTSTKPTSQDIYSKTTGLAEAKRRLKVRNSVDYKVSISIHNATGINGDDHSYIDVVHLLDNSNNEKEDDYSRYNINFKVAHVNDDDYNQTIDIMQYPMLSIVADVNSDYQDYVDQKVTSDNAHKGYVYINNNNTESGSNDWHGVSGFTQTHNPNRYVVTVASLDSDAYMIGDPREINTYNPQGNNSDKIVKDDKNNSLTNYYRTNESKANATMIAPQFMFASSYGVCTDTSLSKEEARSRCATYQEDGYPAGRWRIPTQAEILYVTQLSARTVIPALFSTYTYGWQKIQYWSAQGIVRVNTNGTVSLAEGEEDGLVRCVYDTWRWGTEHDARSTEFVYKTEAKR